MKWTCRYSSGSSEAIGESWQTERNDRSHSHSQTGGYDLINKCTSCELPELEKSLLLLNVFSVDWLLLVSTGSIKLSSWCSEPKNFLAYPVRLFVERFKESCVVWRLVETRIEAPADAMHRIINCNRKAIVRLISSIVFQEHWKQFDNFIELYGW
jgi:hypothetical protein